MQFLELVHGRHDGKQTGMIPEWQLRVYILIYKQQVERKETETETGMGF